MTARSKTERTNTDIEAFMRREKEKVAKTNASHDRPLGSRNQHYTIKVKNKTRFVDSDDEEEEEEEQQEWGDQTEKRYKKTREREAPLPTKSKRHTVTTAMDDFFVVDELQQLSRRPVRSPQPPQQQRRYDKLYRAEEAEEDVKLARLRIMNRHPLIRFYKLVAGAMQADLEDMFVHEDIEREVNRERRERLDATERAQQVEAIRASIAAREKKYEYLTRSEYPRLVPVRELVEELVQLTGDYRRQSGDVGFYGLLALCDDYLFVFGGARDASPPSQEQELKRRKRELWRIIERNVDRKTLPRDTMAAYTYDEVLNLATFILLYRLVHDECRGSGGGGGGDETRPTLGTYECKRVDSGQRDSDAAPSPYTEIVDTEIGGTILPQLESHDKVERGMRKMAMPDSYRSLIRDLIANRGDTLALNELLTKIDSPITQIHGDELNRALRGVTNNQAIIDTIVAYYEEKYDASTSLVEKYEDARQEGGATDAVYADVRNQVAGYFPQLLGEYRKMYRQQISDQILRILEAYVSPGMTLEPTEQGKQMRVIANTSSVLNVPVVLRTIESSRVSSPFQQEQEQEEDEDGGTTTTTTTTTTTRDPNVKRERGVPQSTGTETVATTTATKLATVEPRDLIQDPMFMRYYNEGVRVFETPRTSVDDAGVEMEEDGRQVQTRFDDLESPALRDDAKLASLARLFVDYVTFVSAYIESLRLQMTRLDEQAERIATRGASAAAENEGESSAEEEDFIERMLRRKRQKHASHAYFSAPLNSGIIEIKDDVEGKVVEAYQLVQEFCTGLQGLPLVAFKSDRALESGLASDFANFIAVLFAAANILFPDSYKSKLAYDAIIMRKADMMERLKRYRYTRRYASSTPDAYTILVDNKTRRPPF